MPEPAYLTVEPGPLHDACLEVLDEEAVSIVDVDDLGRGEAPVPGVVLLDPRALSLQAFLSLADRLYATGPGWRFVAVRGGEPPAAQGVSPGHPEGLDAVAAATGPEPDPAALPDLRRLLEEVARARHDINNPLTSALAETQLLLLDVEEEGELREGLEVVQEQLRRIRDLVAGTGHIRPPRPA